VTARAIEDWLTNATERSYQTAFCHLLNAMGYSVIHSTTHGPSEEGKDIIAKDIKGRVTAFQLKRGNINVGEWQKIHDQIVELVELPVRHSSVKPSTKHQPILVTTGFINEHVVSRIEGQNRSWKSRSFHELETWSGSELLMQFIRHTGSFIPEPVPEFHRLLGMMVKGGRGQLDKDEFDLILRSILPLGEKKYKGTRKEVLKKVRAAAVIVEFALASFDKAGNDSAKIEAYVLFACYILALAMRYRIQRKVFEPTLKLIEEAVDGCTKNLWEATRNSKNLIDPMTEPVIAPYRNTITYGTLAAHGLWCLLGGKSSWFDAVRKDLVKEMTKKSSQMFLASEAFVPAKFLISEFLRQHGQVREGNEMFKKLLQESILRKVEDATSRPLWDPYIPMEEAILRDLGKPYDTFLPQTWARQSHSGYALILVAAKRLLRQDLQSLWYKITSLIFHEFVPVREYEILIWKNRKGTMVLKMVPRPESWRKLCKESEDTTKMPRAFAQIQHWLPYFLLVYPHRFSADRILAIVEAVGRSSKQRV
jgi:hypothetical protein